MTMQSSSAQKIALAGIVIGSLMCLTGAFAPYWIVSDPKGFGILSNLVSKYVKGSTGLFMYCVEIDERKTCKLYDFNLKDIDFQSESGWYHSVRVAAAACALLSGISCISALCLACCNCCQRYVALGILAFCAAGAGVYAVVVFSQKTEVFTSSVAGFKLSSYGWAFYVFCAGSGIMGLVSFIACFAAPDNQVGGVVINQPAPANPTVIAMTSQQQQQQNMYPPNAMNNMYPQVQ